MSTVRTRAWVLAAWIATTAWWPGQAIAQGTDAYRNTQLFPIVVDSASFTQRFTFRAPGTVTLVPRFWRAEEQGPNNEVPCPALEVVGTRSVASLRDLCPSLPAGTQYGMLRVAQQNNAGPGFAGFSRVSNPQGQGFSVEAFGMEQFSSIGDDGYAGTVVGIRRLAATATSPAFQTNCFYGAIPKSSALLSSLTPISVNISIHRTDGGQGAGTLKTIYLGTLYRLLDVFAALGMPPGDVPDASFRIEHASLLHEAPWALIAFCTVQDNTSFGADFRIGKHDIDDTSRERFTQDQQDGAMPSGYIPRLFEIEGGANWSNTHVIYFRHPDRIGCSLLSAGNGSIQELEMRLVEADGTTVVAGGNNVLSFSGVYLGDRAARKQGTVGRYTLQVEGDGFDSFTDRQYRIECTSGSGHTRPDLIRSQTGSRF